MAFPIIPVAGMAINYLSKKLNPPKSGMLDPSQYREMFMPNAGAIRQGAMRNAAMSAAPAMSNIRRFGAAGRLPAGATLSAMKGAGYDAAQAGASVEPQIAEMQMQGNQNYFNAINQYSMGNQAVQNYQNESFSGDIGSMTKLAMLWQSGYFDQPGGGQQMGQAQPGVGGQPGMTSNSVAPMSQYKKW